MLKKVGLLTLMLAGMVALSQPAAAQSRDWDGRHFDRREDRREFRREERREDWREHEWRERQRDRWERRYDRNPYRYYYPQPIYRDPYCPR